MNESKWFINGMMPAKIMHRHLILILFLIIPLLTSSSVMAQSVKSKNKKEKNKTWAEQLGFPKGKKVLLLHMDDIGMCPEANEAAERYIKNNHILSAAVMMPCPNATSFIEWAKSHPSADIGLHLTLTSEWKNYRWPPLTDAAKVPSLIDPDGKFWHEVPDVVAHASAKEVEMEIRAQIEKCLALGYRPTHIDTHMGTLIGSPEYVKVFFKVAEEYGIPANVIDITVPEGATQFRQKEYPVNDDVINTVAKYKLPKLDDFTYVHEGSTYEDKRTKFFTMVKSLNPGLTEIYFHPSVLTDNLKTITNSWQQRVWEADLFADPVVHQFFKKEGIVITNWKEVMKRFGEKK